jgi:hypothetical protein
LLAIDCGRELPKADRAIDRTVTLTQTHLIQQQSTTPVSLVQDGDDDIAHGILVAHRSGADTAPDANVVIEAAIGADRARRDSILPIAPRGPTISASKGRGRHVEEEHTTFVVMVARLAGR